jgi:hypothetical protein
MTDEEAEVDALADPMSEEQLRAASPMPQVRVIRRALRLT